MRCACQVCDTYMVHSEGLELGCVCPACGYRCKACLGTDSVVSRENLKSLGGNARLLDDLFADFGDDDDIDDPFDDF